MKLEALQSLSVGVMIAGLFLSALGGFGAYFFSGGSERPGRAQSSARIEMTEPDLPMRDVGEDSRITSLIEPIDEVTARQLSLNPDPALPPIPEKPPAPEPVAVSTPTAKPVEPAPAPVVATTEIPHTSPLPPPVAEKLSPIAAAAAHLERSAPPKTESASQTAAIEIPEKMPPPAPVAEKLPSRAASASAPTRAIAASASLGVEPWQKDKLLQRLRSFQNGALAIQVPEGNAEAMNFATALKEAFVSAGWEVTALTEVKVGPDQTGLTLSSGTFPPPAEVTTIFSALVSAGIKLSTDLDPSLGKKRPVLFIGSRR